MKRAVEDRKEDEGRKGRGTANQRDNEVTCHEVLNELRKKKILLVIDDIPTAKRRNTRNVGLRFILSLCKELYYISQ